MQSSNAGSPSQTQIPPVVAPPVDAKAKAESSEIFGAENAALDYRARFVATSIALLAVVVLYGLAVCTVVRVWPLKSAPALNEQAEPASLTLPSAISDIASAANSAQKNPGVSTVKPATARVDAPVANAAAPPVARAEVRPATVGDSAPLVAVIVALFSVPTVILIAVLRSVTRSRNDEVTSLQSWIGEQVVNAVEKLTTKN